MVPKEGIRAKVDKKKHDPHLVVTDLPEPKFWRNQNHTDLDRRIWIKDDVVVKITNASF